MNIYVENFILFNGYLKNAMQFQLGTLKHKF